MTGEFLRCPVVESPVRTTHIVFPSPGFDELSSIFQIAEPVGVEALGAEGPVERLAEGVVSRLMRWSAACFFISSRGWLGASCDRRIIDMQIHSVGIDLGKTTFHLVALGAGGKVLVKKKFTQKQLLTYTANMQTLVIGLEACSGVHFLGRALRKQGHDPLLLVPVVTMRGTGYLQDTACMPFTHPIALLQILHHRATPGGL
jgi:hypothetical protein